jgi:hypothetical protein
MDSKEQGTGSGTGARSTINLNRTIIVGSTFNQDTVTNLFHHALQAPPAPVEDNWIGGERSLSARETFMVGPEKL